MAGSDDVNGGAVFEGAKLLELFGVFERRGLPTNELQEKIAPVAVDADMPEWSGARGLAMGFVALEWDEAAGKIEGSSVQSCDDFDVVGIERVGLGFKGAGRQ